MPEKERAPDIITAIENADTPLEAVRAAGHLSLRLLVELPIEIGRDLLKITMSGDKGEMVHQAASRLS